jgi:acylphosphatase
MGLVQAHSFKTFIQKTAQSLSIEGTLQNTEPNSITIFACGPSVSLEKFIDALYKGTGSSEVKELTTEPFVNERDFRGVFRIIGD